MNLILIRFGELGLKGHNRPYFQKKLKENIMHVFADQRISLKRTHGRIYLETSLPVHEAVERLQRVFGIVGIAPARKAELDMGTIKEGAKKAIGDFSKDCDVTFKVESRRANKAFPLNSLEISKEIGAHLLQQFPHLKVDVHNPELVVNIEIREQAYIYIKDYPGPGGLPVGTGGRGLLLLSGGIDSPVAGWMMLKRGVRVKALHFYSSPYTNERSLEKVRELVKTLKGWGLDKRLLVVNFTPIQELLIREVPNDYLTLIMRRMMVRIAGMLATNYSQQCLISGESLGQVASQTIESLYVTGVLAQLPLLRPLIGLDKEEIICCAQKTGTYETSIQPHADCCQVFVPTHPVTRPQLTRVEALEAKIDYGSYLDWAVEAVIEEEL